MSYTELISKVVSWVLSAYFFISELLNLVNGPAQIFASYDDYLLYWLRLFLSLFVLPLLYLFRILNHFDLLSVTSFFFHQSNYRGAGTEMFQVELFYWAVYIVIIILAIIKFLGFF